MSAKLIYTGYSEEQPRCIDAVSTILVEEGFHAKLVGEEQKKKMLDEAVIAAWKENDCLELKGLQMKLANANIKNLGETGARELLGKLGVWFTFVRL